MRILAYAEYTKSQLKIFHPSLKTAAAYSRVMDCGTQTKITRSKV